LEAFVTPYIKKEKDKSTLKRLNELEKEIEKRVEKRVENFKIEKRISPHSGHNKQTVLSEIERDIREEEYSQIGFKALKILCEFLDKQGLLLETSMEDRE